MRGASAARRTDFESFAHMVLCNMARASCLCVHVPCMRMCSRACLGAKGLNCVLVVRVNASSI